MDHQNQDSRYVLGHTDGELLRLARQAEFFAEATEDIFVRAGIREGMRVLDLGCGVGDVSLIAGKLVGETGSVVGVDRSPQAIATAARRAQWNGLRWVEFAQRDILDYTDAAPFDAVVGRFILLHLINPETALKRISRVLKPHGILAFAEMDIRSTHTSPPMPLLKQCVDWIIDVYLRAGLEPDMGSQLYRVFRAAGFSPGLSSSCRIQGGANEEGLSYLAETIRSMIPALLEFGICDEATIAIDTLSDRLSAEAAGGEHCIVFPRLVGAWARVAAVQSKPA
jgi:ubiquinone/menaquinone biosynthesis C-methylase UbiE